MEKKKFEWTPETIAMIAMLLALKLVLSRISVPLSPENRLSFGFIGTAILGILYGPFVAGLVNAGSDLLTSFLFGSGGPFFIGFTFSAFLGGVFYGFFLNRYKIEWYHILGAVLCNTLITNLILNTLWVHMLYQTPIPALILMRLPQNMIMAPLRFGLIWLMVNTPQLQKIFRKFQIKSL